MHNALLCAHYKFSYYYYYNASSVSSNTLYDHCDAEFLQTVSHRLPRHFAHFWRLVSRTFQVSSNQFSRVFQEYTFITSIISPTILFTVKQVTSATLPFEQLVHKLYVFLLSKLTNYVGTLKFKNFYVQMPSLCQELQWLWSVSKSF